MQLMKFQKLENFDLFSNRRDFVKEFTVECKFDAKALCNNAEKNGFLFDYIDTNLIKFAFTGEKNKKGNR